MEAPKDAREVMVVLGQTIANVHNGTLETKRAATMVYAALAFVRVLEISNLESRIQALEEKAVEQAHTKN